MESRTHEGFVIKDEKADAFTTPVFYENANVAIRAFQEIVNDPKKPTLYAKHPEDFSLWRTSYYNELTGESESDVGRTFICQAADLCLPPASLDAQMGQLKQA